MREPYQTQPFFAEKTPETERAFKYDHEIGFIGDTNGDLKGFLKNLLSLGYVEMMLGAQLLDEQTVLKQDVGDIVKNAEFFWKAGNAHLYLLGDVLGDRQGEGDKILAVVSILREQATSQGGDIVVHFGNHDASAVKYLVYGQTKSVVDISPCPLDEYMSFSHDAEEDNGFGEPELYFDREAMYQDEKFIEHIRHIKENYEIIRVENETLFLHPDVRATSFMELCEKYRRILHSENPAYTLQTNIPPTQISVLAERMQKDFKQGLDDLFPEKTEGGKTVIEFLPEEKRLAIAKRFFEDEGIVAVLSGLDMDRALGLDHTQAGVFPAEYKEYPKRFIDFLRNRGIKRIVFGHTPHTLQIYNDFQVISTDGKSLSTNDKFSCGKIGKDGTLDYNVTPRTAKDAAQERLRNGA